MGPFGKGFTAAQIAKACGGTIAGGSPRARAVGVSTDTRTLTAGQAFFALVGPRHDGHQYLSAAAAAGAPVLVAQRLPADWAAPHGAAVVLVADTTLALLALAAWHRRGLRGAVAAVTGSYGKSTVKDMIGAVLSGGTRCTVAPASFNNRIGVALTLLSAKAHDDYVVLEMGTNHRGEIDELARAARPDLGLITAVGEVHLEGLGCLKGVREAKAELIPHLARDGVLILNADDPRCASLAERFGGRVRTFGVSPEAGVRTEAIQPSGEGWQFNVGGRVFRLPYGPRHNVMNAAAAICATMALGAPACAIAHALETFRPQHMRYERLDLGGVTFICDCYNSNPPAVRAALQSFLMERAAGRKAVVCGDMLELGAEGPRIHREIGAEIAASGVYMLVAVGELAPHLIEGWHSRARPGQCGLYFRSAEQAWAPLWCELRPGDAVLLKGSRAMKLETITERIAAHLSAKGKEAA
jgi:UDP-N-acetylmuramoyl-tripeptide--D-alanyl-D-alanine ligase